MEVKKKNRMKMAAIIIIITAIIMAILFLTSLNHPHLSADDLNKKLENLVSALVIKDKSIRNCVLSVMKGDGSYSWEGAAGVARQQSHEPMSYLLRKEHTL